MGFLPPPQRRWPPSEFAMIQNVLQRIGGIENYGILSILLFFAVFLGMLVWACRLKQGFLQSMASLPLAPDAENSDQPETSHE